MGDQGPLAEYLQACRARLHPDDVGLPTRGERRRVPGLRREEVAGLAGVSASYYIRLEQGQSVNASDEVIDSIARALLLDDAELEHLRVLARPARRRAVKRPPAERVDPVTEQLLAGLGEMPAIVLGRRTDVLAWNRAGHAFFAGHLDIEAPGRPADRPNMARLVFLDAHTRELYPQWPPKARAVVGNLRVTAGRHPEDTELSTLIGELATHSAEFATLWADHRVLTCTATEYPMRHPLVGDLTVHQQTLSLAHAVDQTLVVVTAEAGSSSRAALTLLTAALCDA
ncbi:transcriptional regulator with XRE-family HTH domain [Amycolatopsis bartoniae]|uniref:Transcriptional regulator n=1 Tax=Amycolatopsis bartoniae TaxID=941986 RepID=A0A8H9IP73_9PSEU|nr:helix-turn-helix transcriptional regulator [Amycolatopsis bartoniae]MBB2938094.1 transcriptional regulator with XRE-family HTH domain [Amycolatopsis bartoniae]TVT01251.1 helix-turn-helix transcriptional regulator [Amycolatopsis bartoniae]GHF32624.1 transcriptional regulator [Amycolatopsis bartoniae]